MQLNKTHLIVFLVGAFLGFLSGFFSGKAIYDKPLVEKVTLDTITIHDTIPDINPAPKDSARIKYVTRWLPAKHDTINHFVEVSKMMNDTVAVEVPITSKHYKSEQYDAYISGFEPNLDSIFVYQKTEYITETIERMKPPDKWELDIVGGINYNTAQDRYSPYAVGELMYKPNRFQFGIQGGVVKNEKVEPIVGIMAKFRLL